MKRIAYSAASLAFVFVCAALLAGCAAAPSGHSPSISGPLAASSASGSIHGGQQPVSGAVIQLYAVNTSSTAGASSALIPSTITTSDGTGVGGNPGNGYNSLPAGSFTITSQYTCPTISSTPVYLVATGGNPGLAAGTNNSSIAILAALGPCSGLSSSQFISANEVTTIAAVGALGSLMTDYAHVGSASTAAISAAFSLANELANTGTGLAPGTGVPANSYVPVAKIYTLANVLASCINSTGSGAAGNSTPCGQLFTAATFSGKVPADTVAAAIGIAANPTTNVAAIFNLGGANPPFQSALSSAPASWSLPIASVSWATPSTVDYGTTLSGTQLDAAATVPGAFTYTPAAGAMPHVGSNPLAVTFVPTDSADYPSAIAASTTLLVSNTPLITWATPAGMTVGVPLGANQLNASAPLPGSFVYSPAAGAVLAAGTYTLSVTFTPNDTSDYTTNTASVSVTVNNPSYTWGNVAIVGGGYVDGIVVHPSAANVRYAKTDVGGAYSWNQNTGLWVPITDFFTHANFGNGGCESIAIDPSNANNLYLGMGQYTESYGNNGIILVSNNAQQPGGPTFTQVSVPFKMGSNDNGRTAGERMAVDPNLGAKLYYGSYKDGLWVSTTSGASWSKVTTFPVYSATTGGAGTGGTSTGSTGYNGAGVVFVDFVASSGSSGTATPVIYVGVSDTGTSGTGYSSLYVSINAGSTWTAVPGQPTGFYPIRSAIGANAAGPNNILYVAYSNGIGPAGVTGGALYSYVLPPSTSPGGAGTWTNITPGAGARQSGSQGGFASIVPDPNNPGVVMATTLDDYYPGDDIYRSINYGASWNSVVDIQGATYNSSLSPWVTFGNTTVTNHAGTWPSSLVIDPANSNHVLYGTGQTLWDSTNIQVSDSGGKAAFSVGAGGIEETVVQALSSTPLGPYLISGVGDLGGFAHTSLTASPGSGAILTGAINPITSIDYAQNSPTTVAIVGKTKGAYSLSSGSNWATFAASPAGTTNGQGQIAVSSGGGTFVWAPSDAAVAYSTNTGTTWTASTGATKQSGVVADRVTDNTFYIYTTGTSGSYNGTLQKSSNGGQSFTTVATGLTNYAVLYASSAAAGDLWLASTTNGLFHSTNGGVSFSAVSGFSYVYAMGFGAAAPGASYPAIYLIGQNTSSAYGFFRSVNGGSTWTQINDANHQYGYAQPITGDPKQFGRVYIGTGGRGVVLGTSTY